MNNARIAKYVFGLGISPRHKGFCYICEVLEQMSLGSGYLAACAELCRSRRVNRRAAERCMRYAISFAWDMRLGSIRAEFGSVTKDVRCPPAPSIMDLMSVALWKLSADEAEFPFPSAG